MAKQSTASEVLEPAGRTGEQPGGNGERVAGPRSRKGAETRARLLKAAKEIFEEDGFFDARISDISTRAQLSHGSFYHYFDSKDEIFREVAGMVEDELAAPLGSIIFDPTSTAQPHQRIRKGIRATLASYQKEARIMRVIEQVSRYDAELLQMRAARHKVANELIIDSLTQLQKRGMIDRKLDVRVAISVLGAMMNRFPEAWLIEGEIDCDFDKGADQLYRIFINALGLSDTQARRPAH
ncbi:TetR/AcrR family transcriptional regulator [Acidiferrimicrobium sp. IK]|uniref:TetR/AcrR family transcriptional regulator n=1 Tax=Acidiferrimicrobium sp. IK TaxID=2871700 RepID=UPI0021CB86BB|nr:TetR/AcrR family transcriptional regulator [Acidiferrimicrobium sp. IK]MCU4182895.1 TetR/AcrR family transcriptional regulator [Acidiferrimicrobium sp. IK]